MYLLYKKQLETCLACIERFKFGLQSTDKKEVGISPVPLSLTYAGRLDPLASGLLIVLDQSEISQKEAIMQLPKTYEVDIVFGLGTDTFDQLGVIYPSEEIMTWKTLNFDQDKIKSLEISLQNELTKVSQDSPREETRKILTQGLQKLIGKVEMHYPFFSSKPVESIPLFEYTKKYGIKKANQNLPTKEVEIYKIECFDIGSISREDLIKESLGIAQNMSGDFRQVEITDSWKKFDAENIAYPILRLRITCSSGFYIRSLAMWLGQISGKMALARDIKRISVGQYSLEDAII